MTMMVWEIKLTEGVEKGEGTSEGGNDAKGEAVAREEGAVEVGWPWPVSCNAVVRDEIKV